MTSWFRPAASVLIVALALSTLFFWARSRNPVRCATADDLLQTLNPKAVEKAFGSAESGWLRHARVCDEGEYLVATSIEKGSRQVFVLAKGTRSRPVFGVIGDTTIVFNADRNGDMVTIAGDDISLVDALKSRVLFQLSQGESGRNAVGYVVHDASRDAWIDYMDTDVDGTMDLRFTEIKGQPQKKEFRIGDRWLEFASRNGQTGVLLDGQWMSVKDARAKLESRAASRQKTGK